MNSSYYQAIGIAISMQLFGVSEMLGQASNTISGSAAQIDVNPNPYGQIQVIKAKAPSVQGSFYYYSRWTLGNVYLFNNNEVKDILIRYNLRTQQVEMKTRLDDPDVKVVDAKYVKNFFIQDYRDMRITHFRNKRNYNFEEDGFFEVIEDGKIQLLGNKNVMYVEGHYVQAIDVGERDDRILQLNKAFVYINGEILKAPRGHQKWKRVFAKHDIDISKILNKYDIDTGLLEGKVKLVSYINIMLEKQ